MPDIHDMISLAEYAKLHGIAPTTANQRAARGAYKTAVKIGRNWVIDRNEPHTDHRVKTGTYIGDHAKRKQRQKGPAPDEDI